VISNNWQPPIAIHHNGSVSAICSLLCADRSSDSSRAWTSKDLLHTGSAVAARLSCTAIKLLATRSRAENVVLVGKRVSKFSAKLVVNIVGLGGRRVSEEEGLGESSAGGNLDSRAR
jgi:hypothetical protein